MKTSHYLMEFENKKKNPLNTLHLGLWTFNFFIF
jgi:hypothetical protein